MAYLGDFRLGDTLDFHFTTRQISGAPFTLASSPVLSAYVGNNTTEITAGITLDVDFDSRTGLNHVRIVATSGNGYATASNYSVVITTGTVNSVSVVGEVVANFSIECRSALMPATAARTLVVDAAGLADANTVKLGPSGSGTAQTAGDVGAKTGFALTAAYDPAKTASQAGDAMALTGGERTSLAGVINTTAITESYRANGATPTPAQFMSEVLAHLGEAAISGTTKTINKLDHSTHAATFTLDSATTPAAITRAT
jgi:hypothetical protein